MDDERIKLVIDLANSGADVKAVAAELAKLDAQAKKVDAGMAGVSAAAVRTDKSMKELSRGALQTSQALQDISQGGPAAALNNLDGIVGSFAQSLGLSATAAATLSAGVLGLGTAVLVLGPPLKELVSSLFDGSNAIPKSRDALERLNGELATSKKRLEELKDKQSLSNDELAEYNTLVAETTRLEKAANAERERRKETEQARNQKTDQQSALARDFGQISGGADYDAIVANAGANTPQGRYNALRKEYEGLGEKIRAGAAGPDGAKRYADMAGRLNQMAKGGGIVGGAEGDEANLAQVQGTVNKARQGDLGAFDSLLKTTTGDVRERLQGVDPRAAGQREANKKLAESQIGDFLSDLIAPVATRLKQANQAIRDIRETDKDMQEMTDKVLPEQRKAWAPVRQMEDREAVKDASEASERATNGGFTGAEGEALARGNMAVARGSRGAASEADIRKALAENEAAMANIEAGGGGGDAALQAFLQTSIQLRQVLGQLQEMQARERMFGNAARQINNTGMGRLGRPEGQGDGRDPWPVINDLAAHVGFQPDALQQQQRPWDAETLPTLMDFGG